EKWPGGSPSYRNFSRSPCFRLNKVGNVPIFCALPRGKFVNQVANYEAKLRERRSRNFQRSQGECQRTGRSRDSQPEFGGARPRRSCARSDPKRSRRGRSGIRRRRGRHRLAWIVRKGENGDGNGPIANRKIGNGILYLRDFGSEGRTPSTLHNF